MWESKNAIRTALESGCDTPIMQTVEDRLEDRKKGLEQQLADINALLVALKANPDMLTLLNLCRKVGI